MAQEPVSEDDYLQLNDLMINLSTQQNLNPDGTFTLCFWLYLLSSIYPPVAIIRQIHSDVENDVPFLVLNEERKMGLMPLLFLHQGSPIADIPASWVDAPCVSAEVSCPLEKWVHVGCEVGKNFVRLHIDGVMVGEKYLSFSEENDSNQDNLRSITLAGSDIIDKRVQGYAHYVRVLAPSSITNHFVKNPPLELSLDGSSCVSENHEVEEGGDGIWSVVGGKASCRRNFSLDVVLLDALGRSVHKEMELVALLVYADNGVPVEKPKDDAESPLLTTFDGVEFPSTDRPIKLLHGRASFKLKISQLSSKCDNRLFRVRFDSLNTQRYPFLEVYSRPIRCVSRNRNTRTSPLVWKKPISIGHQFDMPQSSGPDEGSPEIQQNNGDGPQTMILHGSKLSPPLKRIKFGQEKLSTRIHTTFISEVPADRCKSQALTTNDGENAYQNGLDGKFEKLEGADDNLSDSESVHTRNSDFKSTVGSRSPISDLTLFKYCLEGMNVRAILLKEIINSASDQDIEDFAMQVSLYTGCSHNRHQILIAKRLVEEANQAWKSISRNAYHVLWKNAAREIEKKFLKISCSTRRGLSGQDMEFLQRIAGCCDTIARENFDKLWRWLFPVALALSKGQINAVWECTSPKWIEGMITKEEAESSLKSPRGLQKPGTFVLRFPTSRSWPHPDSGSLVISYVGADNKLHHKLLSLHYRETNEKPLQELLLAEPELSQLGRVTRQAIQSMREEV